MKTSRMSGEGEVNKIIAIMLEPNQEEHPRQSCSRDNEGDDRSDSANVQDDVNKNDGSQNEIGANENDDNDTAKNGDQRGGDGETGPSVNSSTKSAQLELERCSESLASCDSNKENLDSQIYDEYDNTDLIPLPQLLKIHVKQSVSGFEFGEATKRRAQENMKTARDKKMNENRKSGEFEKEADVPVDSEKPCCSKTLSEKEHKTPHSHKRQRLAESRAVAVSSDKDFCKATRRVPACLLDHPDCMEVWIYMVYKEEAALKLRNPRLFNDFKSVTPRMRAILLDWLMEVAEVYHLRRVTYYLSVDYFDRFLSIRPDIPKSLLQLVGITCLYIAAKVEEIYPPNLSEFAYVCDGACKSKEMVSCELLILNSLGWEVVLTTPTDWLNLYMQLHFKSKDVVRASLNMDFNKDFIFPQYSAYQFTRASQLMDLLSLDPGFLKFGYSVIAAAAMYFMYDKDIALYVSGLTWQQLKPCVDYMEAFYNVIKDAPDPRLHSCLGGPNPEEVSKTSSGLLSRVKTRPQNENYSFQTHVASMEYFEKATIQRLSRQKISGVHSSNNNSEGVHNNNVQTSSSEVTEENTASEVDDGRSEDLTTSDANTISTSLVEKLAAELTTHEDNPDDLDLSTSEQNLMSLDEIFELILNQDELKNSDIDD